jgi:hypothetical protein
VKRQTRTLIGPELDLAVIIAQRLPGPGYQRGLAVWNLPIAIPFSPSTRWMDGGPLIDQYGITVGRIEDGLHGSDMGPPGYLSAATGLSNLMSAMRTLVLHKIGEEVELP